MTIPLADVLENFVSATINYIPNVISAIILLIIGLIVGKVVGRIVKEVLVRIKLDKYLMGEKKMPISITNILSVIVRWWIYLAFITAAVSKEILGIETLANWMTTINNFIPKVVGAALIIIVGYILGEYIKEQINKTKTIYANLVGKVMFFLILYVAVAIALPILGIPAGLVSNILLVIIGSLGLGVAIALGLGLKDVVRDVAKQYLKTKKFK